MKLYYPTKPYIVTQPWGEKNDAYLRFGYSCHNGIDIAIDADSIVRAMCDAQITESGFDATKGNYLRMRTYRVDFGGSPCIVEFVYMHGNKLLVKSGDYVKSGDPLMIAGNTGYSFGPHTHITCIRFDDNNNKIDKNDAENTYDFSKEYNGLYADDIGVAGIVEPCKAGDKGDNVKLLQTKLISRGYVIPAGATGFYGPQTINAVFKFQLEHCDLSWYEKYILRGMNVGPKTLKVLNT